MPASSKALFEEAYQKIADRLELPGRADVNSDVTRLVHNWLCDATNGQWILILDNVDEVATSDPARRLKQNDEHQNWLAWLADYLPHVRHGRVLITSRSQNAVATLVKRPENVKEVRSMNEIEGLELLRKKLQDASDEEGAEDLLFALECVPLAISQAAAYINQQPHMTILGYLNGFRANVKNRNWCVERTAEEVLWGLCASNAVMTAWQMSFECIREKRRSAADLLSLMSFFDPQGIPKYILRRQCRNVLGIDEADQAFHKDLETLQSYCLVETAAEDDMCKLNTSVQFCTRIWLSSSGFAERWERMFIELMAKEFPTGRPEHWPRCQQLLPHLRPLFDSKPATDELTKGWAKVLTNAAWYLCTRGSHEAAENVVRRALSAREEVVGLDDKQTLRSTIVLGMVLYYQEKYEEAEKLNRQALKGTEEKFGPLHPGTVTSVGNLAVALQNQKKYEEAEKLNRRALDGWRKLLGSHHPLTVTSFNNLSLVLHAPLVSRSRASTIEVGELSTCL